MMSILGRHDEEILAAAGRGDWPEILRIVVKVEQETERLKEFFVELARRDGLSFGEIGEALGVTAEAVRVARKRRTDASVDPEMCRFLVAEFPGSGGRGRVRLLCDLPANHEVPHRPPEYWGDLTGEAGRQ